MPKKNKAFLWAIGVIWANFLLAMPENINIMLCCENCSQKENEINDALMLQLLIRPRISISTCSSIKEGNFLFKQEVRILDAERIMLVSNLFHPDGYSMFGRLEFFKSIIRSVMNKRAILLAQEIIKAILDESHKPDMFQMLKFNSNPSAAPKMLEEKNEPEDLTTLNKKSFSLGLGVGLTSKTHVAIGASDLKKVASKSFLITGINLEAIFESSWLVKGSFYGGYVDLRVARPITIKNYANAYTLSFMGSVSLLKLIYDHDQVSVLMGAQILSRMLNSKLDMIIKNAVQPRYIYLEQGVVFIAKKFSQTLNTEGSIEISFSPFLQSIFDASYLFGNFGWMANVNLVTNLYKSFFASLSLGHHGESLCILNNVRVVTYGQVGFLGLIAQI